MAREPSWTYDELKEAVCQGDSFSDVLRSLGLSLKGDAIHRIRNHTVRLGLSTSHFTRSICRKPLSIDRVFFSGSRVSGSVTKKAVLRYSLLPYECLLCGNKGVHNSEELVLQLDHINGDRRDNRLENLRFLCPNCHSQTPTFTGKNCGRKKTENPNSLGT